MVCRSRPGSSDFTIARTEHDRLVWSWTTSSTKKWNKMNGPLIHHGWKSSQYLYGNGWSPYLVQQRGYALWTQIRLNMMKVIATTKPEYQNLLLRLTVASPPSSKQPEKDQPFALFLKRSICALAHHLQNWGKSWLLRRCWPNQNCYNVESTCCRRSFGMTIIGAWIFQYQLSL